MIMLLALATVCTACRSRGRRERSPDRPRRSACSSGDDDGESGMSTSVGRVVHRVCMSEASSGDVGVVAGWGCACEAECATHTVVRDADQVRCKHAVNAQSRRNALHVLRLVLVLLLLVTLARGAVCDALVELFTDVGVPSKGISYNGTNFSSQLTQELLRRLECSQAFATPGHPQASGLVERLNRTCQDVLLRVVQRRRRQWRRVVPSARDVSAGLSKPVEACMIDLRVPVTKTADWAELHARHSQDVDKRSDEGDQEIVLDDDAADKLCERWRDPATVVRIISPDSYFIDIGDGRVRYVQSCDIISEIDVDFSRALVPATVDDGNVLPSVNVDRSKIEHLDPEQQGELLALLDEFAECFIDKPGLCKVAEHQIRVTGEFQPKRMRPYRVPEAMKPEVERQIKELLDAGLIVRSDSPMASPLVCVAKKQGCLLYTSPSPRD